jgi:hypothetical protein
VVVEEYTTGFSDLRPFRCAPELTYLGGYDYDVAGGSLTPNSPVLLLGPTFRFQVASTASPRLDIKTTGEAVVLAWPTNFFSFTLQSTTSLVSPVWSTNSAAPIVVNGQNVVTNPIAGAQQFYRLSQ